MQKTEFHSVIIPKARSQRPISSKHTFCLVQQLEPLSGVCVCDFMYLNLWIGIRERLRLVGEKKKKGYATTAYVLSYKVI